MLNPNLATKISYERVLNNFQNEAVNRSGVYLINKAKERTKLKPRYITQNRQQNNKAKADYWSTKSNLIKRDVFVPISSHVVKHLDQTKGDMKCAVTLTFRCLFSPNQIRRGCVSSPNSLTCIGACLLREIVHTLLAAPSNFPWHLLP